MFAYDITRVEGDDPENPEYVKFILESTDQRLKTKKNLKIMKCTF